MSFHYVELTDFCLVGRQNLSCNQNTYTFYFIFHSIEMVHCFHIFWRSNADDVRFIIIFWFSKIFFSASFKWSGNDVVIFTFFFYFFGIVVVNDTINFDQNIWNVFTFPLDENRKKNHTHTSNKDLLVHFLGFSLRENTIEVRYLLKNLVNLCFYYTSILNWKENVR